MSLMGHREDLADVIDCMGDAGAAEDCGAAIGPHDGGDGGVEASIYIADGDAVVIDIVRDSVR